MVQEKSVGAVVSRREKQGTKFLCLQYRADHWDFPKGHMEKGETEEQTLRRELLEETGIKEFEINSDFREEIVYYFMRGKETVRKTVAFYLLTTPEKEVKISHEHTGFEWLDFESALERTTFENAKELLRKAEQLLNPASEL